MTEELRINQTWRPANGQPSRQIWDIRGAGIKDHLSMGTILISWAVNTGRGGTCSQASFRSWIKHNNAQLLGGIQ